LVTFLRKKISITFQRMQTSSFLSQAIAIGLTTFQLPPPITTIDILRVVGC
jgi:hypothetical protein